jgi:hypothetical protein
MILNENNELTKQGTIRKRKPKTSNIYFTKDTEEAILLYITLDTFNEKSKQRFSNSVNVFTILFSIFYF